MMLGGGTPAGDICSSPMTFSWHMENTDVTLGTPSGCSVGNTTATFVSLGALNTDLFYDGSTSLDIPTSGDFASFSVSSNDIINPAAGTISFWMYIDTAVANLRPFSTGPDADNFIRTFITNTDEIRVNWSGNATVVYAVTTNANIPNTTWVNVIAKYTTADVDPNLSIRVVGYGSEAISNDNPTAWVGTNTSMVVGNSGSAAGDFHIDNLQVYNSWL